MSTTAPVSETRRPLIPPEEKFWQRYSAHNEAPLSGVSSTVLHILILLLILGVGWVQHFLKADEQHRSLSFEPIRIEPEKPGGKGAPRQGDPSLPPDSEPAAPMDGLVKPPSDAPPSLTPTRPPDSNKDGTFVRPRLPGSDSWKVFDGLGTKAREKLGGVVKPGGHGGKDGQRDAGNDKGKGPGSGPGSGSVSMTMRRLERWTILFNTRNESDYLNQIIGLGGILAIPIDEAKARFLVIRDLRNPKSGQEEDLSNLDRIFWFDHKPENLRGLISVLNIRQPAYFVVLFPRQLELKMRQLEREYTRKHHGDESEENIVETQFVVAGVDVRVQSVTMKAKR